MHEASVNPMPSQSLLQAALSETFELQDDHGCITDMQLLSVAEGVHMAEGYTCYSAIFALQPGLAASQGTYRVSRCGEQWSLFLAPVQPDATGRTRLEAVFHYRRANM